MIFFLNNLKRTEKALILLFLASGMADAPGNDIRVSAEKYNDMV